MKTLSLLNRCVRPVYEALRQSLAAAAGVSPAGRRPTFERLEGRALFSASSLDPTFGTGGTATFDFAAHADLGHAVAVLGDGRTLVAGQAELLDGTRHGFLVRLNRDGSLDPTFGTAGRVVLSSTPGTQVQDFTAVAVQHDGKIVAAGEAVAASAGFGDTRFAAVRFNADGTLDTTFGTGGVATADFGSLGDAPARIAVGPGGRVVLVGRVNQAGLGDMGDFGVARFTRDGTLDATFNNTGTVTFNFTSGVYGGLDAADAVAFTAGGRILVGGSVINVTDPSVVRRGYALVRLNPNGTPDATFGTGGVVVSADGGSLTDVAVAADGKILVTGNAGGVMIARYTADGAIDATFGAGGATILPGGPLANLPGVEYRLTTLADGTVAVAGAQFRTGQVRVFGANGGLTQSVDVTAPGEDGMAVALGSDGGLVVAGALHTASAPTGFNPGAWSAWNATADVAVARFALGGGFGAAAAVEYDLLPDVTPDPVPDVTPAPVPDVSPVPNPSPTDVTTTAPEVSAVLIGKSVVRNGRAYKFAVTYTSKNPLTPAVLGGNVRIDGPNGFAAVAQLMKTKRTKDGTGATVTYQIGAPGGTFDATDNGTYAIEMDSGIAIDVPNRARSLVTGGRGGTLLGWFDVTAASRAKGKAVAKTPGTPAVGGQQTIAAQVLGHA